MKYQSQPKQSNVVGALNGYAGQKGKLEAELGQVVEKMSALELKYGVLANNGEDNPSYRQLTMISQLRAAAHSEALRAKGDADETARMTARDPRRVDNTPIIVDSIVSADDEQVLRANLTQLKTKLSDMRTHYLSDHPAVRALQQKVDQSAAAYAEAVNSPLRARPRPMKTILTTVRRAEQAGGRTSARKPLTTRT